MGDDMIMWAKESQKNLKDAIDNLSDSDIGKMRLEKFRSEIETYKSNIANMEAKSKQLLKLNGEKEVFSLQTIRYDLDSEVSKASELSGELETSLESLGESSKNIKDEIRKNINEISK